VSYKNSSKQVSFKVFPNTGDTFVVTIEISPYQDEEEQVCMWIDHYLSDSFVEWEWC